eukprot:m.136451 g.136451  ORF g.136451 m.136451 type:complete len:224 (-) comp14889_c0_seq1:442-1113(-)
MAESAKGRALRLKQLQSNDPYTQEIKMQVDDEADLEFVRLVAEALKTNTELQSLQLKYGILTPVEIALLADALKMNRALIELSITDNNIGDDGAVSLAAALTVNRSLTNLRFLSLSFTLLTLWKQDQHSSLLGQPDRDRHRRRGGCGTGWGAQGQYSTARAGAGREQLSRRGCGGAGGEPEGQLHPEHAVDFLSHHHQEHSCAGRRPQDQHQPHVAGVDSLRY